MNKNSTYIYNALGVKLIKRVSTPQTQNETVYSNGFQYQDTKLQYFPTAEGYVSVLEGKINYVYNYTDHLGNVRLSYGLDPEVQGQLKILSENHYYPYGLKHSNYNAIEYAYKENELGTYVILEPTDRQDYRYKYNGMEYQDELGLNLYDMDFRDYDPAIARWTGIDPVTHHNMSPYMAFDGNPVFWADPSGADAIISPNGITFDGEDARSAFNGLLNFLDGEDSSFDITGKVVVLSDSQSDGGSGGGDGGIIPPGRITFVNLTAAQLRNFMIIPEDVSSTSPIFSPKENGTYEGDGFYFANPTDSKYWYKVSADGEVVVTYYEGSYEYRTYYSEFWQAFALLMGKDYHVGFKSSSQPHWTPNPFD